MRNIEKMYLFYNKHNNFKNFQNVEVENNSPSV